MDEEVTITCPMCGHTETMSAYQAEKYDVANDQICEDCFEKLTGQKNKGPGLREQDTGR